MIYFKLISSKIDFIPIQNNKILVFLWDDYVKQELIQNSIFKKKLPEKGRPKKWDIYYFINFANI